jgi:hypothetical protein
VEGEGDGLGRANRERDRPSQVTNVEMNIIMRFVVPIFSVVWVLAELIRLLLGFMGNLRERVPELAAFLLLTVFPQIPVVIFLSLGALNRAPIDLVAGVPQLIMLLVEAVLAYYTVRKFMRKQTAEFFRACQTDSEARFSGGSEGPEEDRSDSSSDYGGESVMSAEFPSAGEVLAAGVSGLAAQFTPSQPDKEKHA